MLNKTAHSLIALAFCLIGLESFGQQVTLRGAPLVTMAFALSVLGRSISSVAMKRLTLKSICTISEPVISKKKLRPIFSLGLRRMIKRPTRWALATVPATNTPIIFLKTSSLTTAAEDGRKSHTQTTMSTVFS